LVAAGLPQLPELAGEAKSYAERLFRFPTVASLDDEEARKALVEPARVFGVEYVPEAVEAILAYTEGYPYFIQEYGSVVWNFADASPITAEDVRDGRAPAPLGPEPPLAADVAEILGRRSTSVAPTRARLIDKGLLWTPEHGYAAFTVPQFDRFMKRTYQLNTSR
jgi:hypothetical protein